MLLDLVENQDMAEPSSFDPVVVIKDVQQKYMAAIERVLARAATAEVDGGSAGPASRPAGRPAGVSTTCFRRTASRSSSSVKWPLPMST